MAISMSVWALFILTRFLEDVLLSRDINDNVVAILPYEVLDDEVFVMEEDGDDDECDSYFILWSIFRWSFCFGRWWYVIRFVARFGIICTI